MADRAGQAQGTTDERELVDAAALRWTAAQLDADFGPEVLKVHVDAN